MAEDAPLVNSFFKQRGAIENILRACIGLPPINNMLLEYRTGSYLKAEKVAKSDVNVKSGMKMEMKMESKKDIENESALIEVD